MHRAAVEDWVRRYEELWRTPGTDRLGELFAPGVTYLTSPWADPVAELARFWEAERVSADEGFTMTSEVVAVDGATAAGRPLTDAGGHRRSRRVVRAVPVRRSGSRRRPRSTSR